MRRYLSTACLASVVAASVIACFVDPVHDNQVAALGPEDPGVPHGPLHRPGQPCLVCHGGSGPASRVFTVAGTAFSVKGMTAPLPGAIISLTDSHYVDGGTTGLVSLEANQAGNFFVTSSDYQPYWPVHVSLSLATPNCTPSATQTCLNTAPMVSHIGRDGSCADCHFDPPAANSPGRVYLYTDLASVPDGGSP